MTSRAEKAVQTLKHWMPEYTKVIRDGEVIHEYEGRDLRFAIQENGRHRVELWLKIADVDRPWILANPFYVGE